jgi:hypothetical protein
VTGISYASPEIYTAVWLTTPLFSNMTPCHWVIGSTRFEETYCLEMSGPDHPVTPHIPEGVLDYFILVVVLLLLLLLFLLLLPLLLLLLCICNAVVGRAVA